MTKEQLLDTSRNKEREREKNKREFKYIIIFKKKPSANFQIQDIFAIFIVC